MKHSILALVALLLASITPWSAEPVGNGDAPRWPGRQPDGSVLLPNMWSLRPAGHQVDLGDFPINIAVPPKGRFAAILHSGYGSHEILVVDISQRQVVHREPLGEAFYGLEFDRKGRQLYASGAGDEVIHRFHFNARTGALTDPETIRLREVKERGIPAGLTLSADNRHLYVANVWGQQVAKVDLQASTNLLEWYFDDGNTTIPGSEGTGDSDLDSITKRARAQADPAAPEAPFPYACRLDEKRQRLYVSLWAQAKVAVIDLKSNRIVDYWPTEEHPNEMLLTRSGRLLYVANANRNTVRVFDTVEGRALETIWAALHPSAPPGSTPNSLALTPDEKTLFVANANINAVAVFDVAEPGRSRSLGFIPTGWYPTSVRVTPNGKQLLVANGKGIISKANPNGPTPGRPHPPGTVVEYIGRLFNGTLSIIDLPPRKEWPARLASWTRQTYDCSPLQADNRAPGPPPPDNPVPAQVGGSSPIRYCIYILKENRTYDQILGDLPEGNGDANLCLFPEKVTPNHHQLAREFVLLDNFYVESEVSADGHEWSVGAYATDFVEKMWPLSYGHNRHGKYVYPSEGRFLAAQPSGGYLWDKAAKANVTFRSYGEFVQNGATPADPCTSRLPALQGRFDPWFRSFDMNYSDLDRADRFIAELKRFETEGEMPRLQIVRLPNDHTSGTATGQKTPTAFVAENDLALGRVVEAVSKSKFWPQTAIFVVQDDAQNGADHVDAHRTVAFVISPYVKRGSVDSTLYSTSSMLRTMELILGLEPMSQFDAAATPMFRCFQPEPDLTAYQTRPAQVDLESRNGRTAWGREESDRMDFSREDAADDLRLNEIIWRAVKGPQSPMPPPVRAAFVFAEAGDEDDE